MYTVIHSITQLNAYQRLNYMYIVQTRIFPRILLLANTARGQVFCLCVLYYGRQ